MLRKVICNQEEYKKALKEIDYLLSPNVPANDQTFQEFKILADALVEFEDKESYSIK